MRDGVRMNSGATTPGKALMIEQPSMKDREHAVLILDHIKRLRELGEIAERDTRENEIYFIACMLRNEREGSHDWGAPR
jgi:hypothetical protein